MTTKLTNQTVSTLSDNHRIVADHYEINLNHLLGSGGMSLVYAGRDLRSQRPVALKTLRPEYRHDPASRSRFRREIRTMAFIQHPNVATVYDYWEDDTAPWAVLEFVSGRPLQEVIAANGPLDIDLTAHYLNQIADALAHLHDRGLVHLDVKPQNLLLQGDHTIKLIDFGLAQPENESQHLIDGTAFGTAAYLSPEQASGDAVGSYSDVYSVGCLLYEMLTGQPPFGVATAETSPQDVIRAHLQQKPDPPSTQAPNNAIPGWADEIVLWSLDKQPEQRISDIRLLAEFFQYGADGELSKQQTREIRQSFLEPIELVPESEAPFPQSNAAQAQSRSDRLSPSHSEIRSSTIQLVLVTAITTAAIFAGIFLFTGQIPGIVSQVHPFYIGNEAMVTIDGLNFRNNPGLSSATLFQLSVNTQLTIQGNGEVADNEIWIPVSIDSEDEIATGFVWKDGIQPQSTSGWTWLRHRIS